jgi:hypothetical protein
LAFRASFCEKISINFETANQQSSANQKNLQPRNFHIWSFQIYCFFIARNIIHPLHPLPPPALPKMASRRRSPGSSSSPSSPPSSPPVAKRSRFEETDPSLDEFIEVLDVPRNEEEFHGYPIHKRVSVFKIKKFPAHPESALFGFFNEAAARAVIEAKREKNIDADRISFMLNSTNLEEGQPIFSSFQPLEEATFHSLRNIFMKVEQSREPLGKSLFNAPLEIQVTVLQKNGMAQKHKKKMVGGARPRKNNLSITHTIADNMKIDVPNQIGNRCLFYALHSALQKQIRGLERNEWKRYRRSLHGQRGKIHNEVTQLMETLEIPLWKRNMPHRIGCPLSWIIGITFCTKIAIGLKSSSLVSVAYLFRNTNMAPRTTTSRSLFITMDNILLGSSRVALFLGKVIVCDVNDPTTEGQIMLRAVRRNASIAVVLVLHSHVNPFLKWKFHVIAVKHLSRRNAIVIISKTTFVSTRKNAVFVGSSGIKECVSINVAKRIVGAARHIMRRTNKDAASFNHWNVNRNTQFAILPLTLKQQKLSKKFPVGDHMSRHVLRKYSIQTLWAPVLLVKNASVAVNGNRQK